MMKLLFQQPVRKDDRGFWAVLNWHASMGDSPAQRWNLPRSKSWNDVALPSFQSVFVVCDLCMANLPVIYNIHRERERARLIYIDRYEKYSLFVSMCTIHVLIYYIDISIVDLYGEIFHACRGRLRTKLWTKRVPMRLHHWRWASGRESRWVAGEENWHHTTWGYRTQLVSAE